MLDFYAECNRNVSQAINSSFTSIIAMHGQCMHELTKSEAKDSKRGLMTNWVKITRLNDEWIYLIVRKDRPESEFSKLTTKLITSYSEALCDYVLDRAHGSEWKKKISDIVQLESQFFEAIGGGKCSTQWIAYTMSVIEMVDAMVRYGGESETFYNYSAACIRAGRVLGSCLDAKFRK